MCGSIGEALTATNAGTSPGAAKGAVSITEASDALRQAREFMSEASGPPESAEEQSRLTSTLHALDNASRLAEVAGERGDFGWVPGGSEEARAAVLCAEAMRNAVLIAGDVGALPDAPEKASPVEALGQLEQSAKTLRELQPAHRRATLGSVGDGTLSADEAMARVDTVRRFEALARHAWRSAAHLVSSPA
jgi:phosphate:Na+ symporter